MLGSRKGEYKEQLAKENGLSDMFENILILVCGLLKSFRLSSLLFVYSPGRDIFLKIAQGKGYWVGFAADSMKGTIICFSVRVVIRLHVVFIHGYFELASISVNKKYVLNWLARCSCVLDPYDLCKITCREYQEQVSWLRLSAGWAENTLFFSCSPQ